MQHRAYKCFYDTEREATLLLQQTGRRPVVSIQWVRLLVLITQPCHDHPFPRVDLREYSVPGTHTLLKAQYSYMSNAPIVTACTLQSQ